MIQEMILKADYQPVTIINEQRSKLMFKTENVMNPVYKKDGDGNIIVDDEGNPVREQTARGINLSYEAYKGDRNPVKKMSHMSLHISQMSSFRIIYMM